MSPSVLPAAGLSGPPLRAYVERHVLPYVSTPAQYTGGEWNQVVKERAGLRVRIALGFPDTYAMGMSSLGLQILYHVWNREADTCAERVFAPWPDMEAAMRRHGVPLYTLESFTPVSAFDIFALSVAYELGFTNVLTMLDLAGLPLHAAERTGAHPLVIAGGHAAFSPEPLADFVDAFCLGDGEELALDVSRKVAELRAAGLGREELLYRLAREVRGVYVPRFYEFVSRADGTIAAVRPLRPRLPFPVTRRVVEDLDRAPFPTRPVVPLVETVFERYAIEIMRGCANGCRFCQAGMVTRPQRWRRPETIQELARAGLAATGYDEVSLLSLSSSDYPDLTGLARRLNDAFAGAAVSISLPSLRIGTALAALPREMNRVRRSGLTLAPEAASERLRARINKPVRDEDLLAGCQEAFRHGFQRVKLYFMLGLPGETDEDLLGIGRLAERIARARLEMGRRPARVTVSVSSFVAKAGTPFQRVGLPPREEWRRRQELVRSSIRLPSVEVKFHPVEVSYLEAVFARGDRRLGAVLEAAWRNGARFDGWDDQLKMDAWQAAFTACGLDPDAYALRARGADEILPWALACDTVSEDFLRREEARAAAEVTTPSCAGEGAPCFVCDACARSPLFVKKEQMLAAPLAGEPRDEEYARRAWAWVGGKELGIGDWGLGIGQQGRGQTRGQQDSLLVPPSRSDQ